MPPALTQWCGDRVSPEQIFKIKAALDAEWLSRANTYLATHNLHVEVCAFYTSDGKNTTPHLVLQFTKSK